MLVRALSLIAVFAIAGSAHASHSWGGYHWARTSNPFTVKLGDNVSAIWDGHLSLASSDWSKSTVLNTTIVAGGTRPKSCRPTTGRVEVCNASYGNTNWLGIAQIWLSGSHIVQGTTKMNDYYFSLSKYDTPDWRQFVMCQEVGHTFGLDHQDENFNNANLGTCMDYTNDPSTNTHPNQHDYDELDTIYAHLDSTTTVGQTVNTLPQAMNEIDLSHPSSWGRLISSTHGGRTQTFEQDFGGGNRVVTFVIWADGDARGNGIE